MSASTRPRGGSPPTTGRTCRGSAPCRRRRRPRCSGAKAVVDRHVARIELDSAVRIAAAANRRRQDLLDGQQVIVPRRHVDRTARRVGAARPDAVAADRRARARRECQCQPQREQRPRRPQNAARPHGRPPSSLDDRLAVGFRTAQHEAGAEARARCLGIAAVLSADTMVNGIFSRALRLATHASRVRRARPSQQRAFSASVTGRDFSHAIAHRRRAARRVPPPTLAICRRAHGPPLRLDLDVLRHRAAIATRYST